MHGHCLVCDTIRLVETPTLVISKTGKPELYRGTCSVCNGPIYISPRLPDTDANVINSYKAETRNVSR